jgi:hypothetical protein
MFKRFLFLFVIAFTIASCKHETVFTEVKVNNRFSISVPEYMQPCADLHKDASLQYQNTELDIYAMVIEEKKATMENYNLDYDIDTYFKNIASQAFIENIKNGKVSPAGRQTINGNKALTSEITGNIDGTDVYYKLAIVESKFSFYQILTWTRADRKEKYNADMTKFIESFKELPHPQEELPQSKLSDSVQIVPAW